MALNFGTARYLIQIALDKTGADRFKDEISRINGLAKAGVKGVTEAQKILSKDTQNLGHQNGVALRKLRVSYLDVNGAIKTIDSTQSHLNGKWVESTTNIKATNGALGTFNKHAENIGQSFLRLARRAAVTILVWTTLRSAYMALINAVREGITHIIEFDKAMARAKNLSGLTGEALLGFVDDLSVRARALSRETGKPIGEVVETFSILADSGLDVQTSLGGMEVALKASIAFLSDNAKTARFLADVYKLMGDTIQDVTTPTEKMKVIAGTMAILWNENSFTMDEYTDALRNFLPQARNYNLTLDQTLGITAAAATLMSRGASAGTGLSRSFLELSLNADKVQRILGRVVNIDTENQFNILMEVLLKLNKELKSGENIANRVIDVFGVRGSKQTQGFANKLEILAGVLNKLSDTKVLARFADLDKKFQDQTNTISAQIDIFKELRKQTVEAFLQAITGSTDYVEALKKVNDFMVDTLIPNVILLGQQMRHPLRPYSADTAGIRTAFAKTVKNPFAGLRDEDEFGADFVGKKFDVFLKEFNKMNVIQKFRVLTEELGLARQEALDMMSAVDAAAIIVTEFQEGSIARKGKAQSTVSAETETKNAEDLKKLQEEIAAAITAQNIPTSHQLILAERLAAFGASQLEIEYEKLAILGQQSTVSEEYAKQQERILELSIAQVNEVSKALQDVFKEGLSNVLQGEGDFLTMFENIAKKIKQTVADAFAENVTQQIFDATGIGNALGGFIVGIQGKIKQGHLDALPTVYEKIFQAHVDGITAGTAKGAGQTPQDGTTATGGLGGALGSGGKLGQLLNKPFFKSDKGKLQPGQEGPKTQAQAAGVGGLAGGEGMTAGGALALAGSVATLADLYKKKGSGDVFGGVLTGAMAGGTAGFVLGGPIGAAIGATLGAAYGGIRGGQSKTTTENTEATLQVASKIDVTNKKLEIINRNFVALKTNIETYILPDTAYFSISRNLEDQFSISARRGFA